MCVTILLLLLHKISVDLVSKNDYEIRLLDDKL